MVKAYQELIWITGASQGIGKALALAYAAQGAKVIISARNREKLDEVCRQGQEQQLSGELIPLLLDVTNPQQVKQVVALLIASHRLPDRVILNAGTHQPVEARQFSAQVLQHLVQVNLLGIGYLLEELLPRYAGLEHSDANRSESQQVLVFTNNHSADSFDVTNSSDSTSHSYSAPPSYSTNNRSSTSSLNSNSTPPKLKQIALVASVAGYRGLPTASCYGASKAAVINLAESLRAELYSSGIDIRLINPGFVKTPLTDKNDFEMPFLISAEQAAHDIIKGLNSKRFEIVFPRKMAWAMKLLKWLPDRVFFQLINRSTGHNQSQIKHQSQHNGQY